MMIGPFDDWKGKWLKLGLKWWVKGDEMQEVGGHSIYEEIARQKTLKQAANFLIIF